MPSVCIFLVPLCSLLGCLHLQMLSFILILVLCPENKSFQWLLPNALSTWKRIWVLQLIVAQIGWCIWPPVNVHALLREIPYQPQTEPSADHSKRSHSVCEFYMSWNLLHNICFLLSDKRILDLKNGCHWCSALQIWSIDDFSVDCNCFEIYVFAERLMKGFNSFPA